MSDRWFIGRFLGCLLILANLSGCSTPGEREQMRRDAISKQELAAKQKANAEEAAKTAAVTRGETPLAQAAASGNVAQVSALLAQGADINGYGEYGYTALHTAAFNGNQMVAEVLLAHGADVNAHAKSGVTPLHEAILSDKQSIAELLIAHGVDVNATNARGGTPLHYASGKGNQAVVELLIDHGASVNARGIDGITPLMNAAFNGNQAIVEILLAHGADVNTRTNVQVDNGTTPLIIAIGKRDLAIVETLLAHGADVNTLGGDGGTVLELATFDGNRTLVETLLAHGANVNSYNTRGETPLHYAAFHGHQAVAEVLLGYGADVNARAKNGMTPLSMAKSKGHSDIAALLQDGPAIQALQQRQRQSDEITRWKNEIQPLAIQAQNEQKAGHADQAFSDYLHILRSTPPGSLIGTTPYYATLLRELLDTVRQLKTLPPLNQEYRKEMLVGIDAIKTATTDVDFQRAETHFLKASRLTPWSPESYKALGTVLESQKKYKEAASYFKLYLLVQPNAPDAQVLQDRIYVLEERGH
ncbi:MAG: ankyrin repeat domain-containing protein [Betaproteobacteria bacterium]|nr:ankyrin repeat domain-containing protein [Betaproteobacteria bacterium]